MKKHDTPRPIASTTARRRPSGRRSASPSPGSRPPPPAPRPGARRPRHGGRRGRRRPACRLARGRPRRISRAGTTPRCRRPPASPSLLRTLRRGPGSRRKRGGTPRADVAPASQVDRDGAGGASRRQMSPRGRRKIWRRGTTRRPSTEQPTRWTRGKLRPSCARTRATCAAAAETSRRCREASSEPAAPPPAPNPGAPPTPMTVRTTSSTTSTTA